MSWDPPAGIGDMSLDAFSGWMDRVEQLLEEIRDRLPPPPEPCAMTCRDPTHDHPRQKP